MFQPVHTRSEHTRKRERYQDPHDQHQQRGHQKSLLQFDDGKIHLRKRQSQADHNRRISRFLIALRAVHQFAIERDAAMYRLPRAARQCFLKLDTVRVVFHFIGIGRGIGQNLAGAVNDRYARAALGDAFGPTAECRCVGRAGRICESEFQKRAEFIIGRADGLTAHDADGVKVHGEQDYQEQGGVREPELPEQSSLHGFRTGIPRREWFS